MKAVFGSSRDRYTAKFTIFLVMVALIAGMVGCDGWNLTVSSDPGGNVTVMVDGEETVVRPDKRETIFAIANSTEINLVATPDAGYRFDGWTTRRGNVPIDIVCAADTTITMNGSYSVKANFVQGLEIRTWYHLDAIRHNDNLGGNHILMNSLDFNTDGYEVFVHPDGTDGLGWEPIGTFSGTFDGGGHEIRDLFIERPDEIGGVGLFSYVGGKGVVQNVRVTNANVTGDSSVGALAGENYGTVRNSSSTGSVNGIKYVGGLVGWNQLAIQDSSSTGSVSGSLCVGGLVGYNKGGSVTRSNSSSSVTGSDEHVGGLVGWNEGTVEEHSYSSGSVEGTDNVGGLVGKSTGKRAKISDAYSTGNVTGTGQYVGGLVGYNQGTVERCNSTGSVNGTNNVGGLVGYNLAVEGEKDVEAEEGRVTNSYSTGDVGGFRNVGGLVGWNEGQVGDSYSTSSVSGTLSIGGLVGDNVKVVSQSHFAGNVTGDTDVGGLVGLNDRTVEESCSNGTVEGKYNVGGLVGLNKLTNAEVSDCYSRSNVSGNKAVGGLVGYNEQGHLENCYSVGKVTGADDVGGLVGYKWKGLVTNSFWNTQTSGRTASKGGTGKTTAEMKNITTFERAGWEIVSVAYGERDRLYVWNIVNGVTYPFLSWQPV